LHIFTGKFNLLNLTDMKKSFFITGAALTLAVATLFMGGCGVAKRSSAATVDSVSLQLIGTYTGVLPCADCPGIRTRVDLGEGMTYTLRISYIDRKDTTYTSSGAFQWDATSGVITFDNKFLSQGLIAGDTIYVLTDGHKNAGPNAASYVLTKVDGRLVERYWKAIELFGNPVGPVNGGKQAYIVFRIDDNRYHGNAGCNNFMGSYRLLGNGRITFSQGAATMMMCIDMDTETKMMQVINTADSYVIRGGDGSGGASKGDTLVLIRARMAPLARFVAVDTMRVE